MTKKRKASGPSPDKLWYNISDALGRSSSSSTLSPASTLPIASTSATLGHQKMERMHNVVNGEYTTNRRGRPLCSGYNAGQCASRGKSIACPADNSKVHQCSKCLSTDHDATQCDKSPSTTPPSQPGWVNLRNKGTGRNTFVYAYSGAADG